MPACGGITARPRRSALVSCWPIVNAASLPCCAAQGDLYEAYKREFDRNYNG